MILWEEEGCSFLVRSGEARAIARQMIRENKGLLVGGFFAYIGLGLAISLVQLLFTNNPGLTTLWSIGSMFLLIPLTLGLLHINNMVYYKRFCTVGVLFDFFRNYHVSIKVIGVAFIFQIILMVIFIPIALITMVPVFIGAFGSAVGSSYFSAAAVTSFIGAIVLFTLLVLIVAMLFSAMTMASYFIALRNRSISFGNLLGSSLKIGWKYMWKYFVFQLTFIGWVLLGMLPSVLLGTGGAAAMAGGNLGFGIFLLVLSVLLCVVLESLVEIYISAASTVFFNVAIDEYERLHPDYSGYVPPHVPQPPVSGGQHHPEPEGAPDLLPAEPGSTVQEPKTGEGSSPTEMPQEAEASATGAETRGDEEAGVEHIQAEQVEEGGSDEPEKDFYDVILIDPGIGRLHVAHLIGEMTGMSFEEARQLVENVPKAVQIHVDRDQARETAKVLTEAGAKVEIR